MNVKEKKNMKNWSRINKVYRVTLNNLHPIKEADIRMRIIASFSALPDRRAATKILGNTIAEWLDEVLVDIEDTYWFFGCRFMVEEEEE